MYVYFLLIIKYASNFNIKNATLKPHNYHICMSLGCKFTNMNNLLIKAVFSFILCIGVSYSQNNNLPLKNGRLETPEQRLFLLIGKTEPLMEVLHNTVLNPAVWRLKVIIA